MSPLCSNIVQRRPFQETAFSTGLLHGGEQMEKCIERFVWCVLVCKINTWSFLKSWKKSRMYLCWCTFCKDLKNLSYMSFCLITSYSNCKYWNHCKVDVYKFCMASQMRDAKCLNNEQQVSEETFYGALSLFVNISKINRSDHCNRSFLNICTLSVYKRGGRSQVVLVATGNFQRKKNFW